MRTLITIAIVGTILGAFIYYFTSRIGKADPQKIDYSLEYEFPEDN